MLKKRVIPILLYKDEKMVKGINFSSYRQTGLPQSSVRVYSSQEADEIFLLNISECVESIIKFENLIGDIAEECNMPLCIGGGISTMNQVSRIIKGGADKVLLNSYVYTDYKLINKIANNFGRQAVTIGIDYVRIENRIKLMSQNGKKIEQMSLKEHVLRVQDAGAGEIFLNSISRDGTMSGIDLGILEELRDLIEVPLVLGGGAGNFLHLAQALAIDLVSGVACGSIFNFGDNNPIRARSYLKNQGIPVRVLK